MAMMDKRLIGTVKESKKYIAGNVITQWISLIANIAMMTAITVLLSAVFTDNPSNDLILITGNYSSYCCNSKSRLQYGFI